MKKQINKHFGPGFLAFFIGTLILSACTGSQKPTISIEPAESLMDQPLTIRLSGFEPNQEVTVQAALADLSSQATFLTDADGSVDLAKQAPHSGSYNTIDGMGLFWSMKSGDADASPTATISTPSKVPSTIEFPIRLLYQFTASVKAQVVARAIAVKTLGLPGMTRTEVDEADIYGILYMPPGNGPFPAVILVGGSGGEILGESFSQLLASHGFACLNLAVLDRTSEAGGGNLPVRLRLLPLEYFGKAIGWLQTRPRVDPGRIGIIGSSRGGEAALLVGATYPQIKAVISYSAYTIIVAGESDPAASSQAASSWTYQGQPVPFLADDWPEYRVVHPFLAAVAAGKDVSILIPKVVTQMETTPELVSAAIPVEKINGPVLLITGLDDRLLPSALYGEFALLRLEAHHFTFPHQHLTYPGAGNGIAGTPYWPERDNKWSGLKWVGGTAQADEAALISSWPVVLEYLGMMK